MDTKNYVRVKLSVDRLLDASGPLVWSVIGNWKWWAFGPVVIDQADPNTRHLGDGKITETLTTRDDKKRHIKYSMTKNPFGVKNYVGNIIVHEEGERTRVTYIATSDVLEENEEQFRKIFSASLEEGLLQLAEDTSGSGEIQFVIGAPRERLWSIVSNWNNVSWVSGVERATMLSHNERRQYFSGNVFVDSTLRSTDPANHQLTYEVTKTPLALSYYKASLILEELGPEHTRWRYSFKFAPAPGTSTTEMDNYLNGSLSERSRWLQRKFESRTYGEPQAAHFKEWLYVIRYWYLVAVVRFNRLFWRVFSIMPLKDAVSMKSPGNLPQNDPDSAKRRLLIEKSRNELALRTLYPGKGFLTRKTKRLPKTERFPLWWSFSLIFFQLQIRFLLGRSSVVSMSPERVRTKKVLNRIWSFLPDKSYSEKSFESDIVFAQYFVSSTGATLLQQCNTVPSRTLPVTIKALQETDGWDGKLKSGTIFVADFDAMLDLSWDVEDVPAPIVFLGHDDDLNLIPLAIQLNGIAYTPTDKNEWLIAKMWTAKAYIAMTRTVHHGLLSHFTWAGTFAIATYSHLSERHPMRRLIAPFMRYTMQINQLAERLIVNDEGALAGQVMGFDGSVELMRRMEQRMSYDDIHFMRDISKRGVEKVPNAYPYRDDGAKIWKAIQRMVKSRVDVWYPSDDSVAQDDELLAWAYQCSRTISGFPFPINQRSDLVEALTSTIFSVVLHQLHNAPAADHTIVPGRTASLASTIRGVRMPRYKGDGPSDLWKHASLGNVVITLLFDATLTAYNKRINFVTDLEKYCETQAEREAILVFREECEEISREIQSASSTRVLKFDHLDPIKNSAQSVAS